MNGDTEITSEKGSQPLVEVNHEQIPPTKMVHDEEVNNHRLVMDNQTAELTQNCSNEDAHGLVIVKEKAPNVNKMKDNEGTQENVDKEKNNGESVREVNSTASNEEDSRGPPVEVPLSFDDGKSLNNGDKARGDFRENSSEELNKEHLATKSREKEKIGDQDIEEEDIVMEGDAEEDKESCNKQVMSVEEGDEHGDGGKDTLMEIEDNCEPKTKDEDVPREHNTESEVPDENISEATHKDGGDEDNELCIEICDVRTVEFEDDNVDSSDSMTVVDLNQSKDLSQGSATDSETYSPQKVYKKNSSQPESNIVQDAMSEVSTFQKITELSQDAGSKLKTDGKSQNSMNLDQDGNDMLQNLYNQTSSLHDPELSTINTTGDSDDSQKKKSGESSSQKQSSMSGCSTQKQNSMADSSSQRQRSVSESSNESSSVADSPKKTSDLKSSPASSLLSNLANTVKKIKSEPADTGYDKAMVEQDSSPLSESLRLQVTVAMPPPTVFPPLSAVGQTNNVKSTSKQNAIGGQRQLAPKINTPGFTYFVAYPSSTTQPITVVKAPATTSTANSQLQPLQVVKTSPATPTANTQLQSIQVVKTPANSQLPTIQVVRTPSASTKPQPSSIQVVKTSATLSTATQPTSIQIVKTSAASEPTSVQVLKTYAATPTSTCKGDQNTPEDKSMDEDCFQSDVMKMCKMHQVKSVELAKITDFLQRKNGLKSFKPRKPLFGTKIYSCMECGDSFNVKSSLDFHMNRCSMRIQFNCSECDSMQTFYNKCQLLCHMRQHASATTSGQNKVPPPLRISSEHISILSPSKEDLEFAYKELEKVQYSIQPSCLMCNQIFQEEEHLRTHLGAYDRVCSFAYQCQKCPEVLPRGCAFKAHQSIHTLIAPFQCPECGKFSVAYEQFLKHLKDECCHLNRIYLLTCGVCGEKVSDGLTKLKKHIVTHVNTYIKCQFCNLAFDKKQSHFDHIRKFHPGNRVDKTKMSFVYTCMFCKTLLQKAELIERHMEIHVPEMKKNAQFAFKCFQCTSVAKAFVFPSKLDLLNHIKVCHQQKFICKYCQKQFTTKNSLDSHITNIHYGGSNVNVDPKKLVVTVCKICRVLMPLEDLPKHTCLIQIPIPPKAQANSTKETQLKKIKPTTSNEPLPPSDKLRFICLYCKEFFHSNESLDEHRRSCKSLTTEPAHTEWMVYCNVCDVALTSILCLRGHLREHCKKGYFLCKFCKDMAFKRSSELIEHQTNSCPAAEKASNFPMSRKKNAGNDSYKQSVCKICKSVFYSLDLKLKHMAKHRLEGKMICPFCDKDDFNSSEETDRHILRCCQKENPVKHGYCCTCHQTFPNIDQLVVHLQEHLQNGKLLCCKCQKDDFNSKDELIKHNLMCGKKLRDSIPGQVCTLCREVFPTMTIKQLYRHLTNHVVKGVKICCKCQVMGWKERCEMKSHQIACGLFDMTEGKKKVENLTCVICHKQAQHQFHLQQHIEMHRNIGSLICVNCHRMKWKDEDELSQHEEECQMAGGASPSEEKTQEAAKQRKGYITMDLFCEHCGKKYSHQSQLQEHISQEHTTFPCHLCGLAYDSKSALDSHVSMVHDGKKTFFSCDICKSKKISKMFATEIGLLKHVQKAHKHCRRPSGGFDTKKEEGEDSSSSMASTARQQPASPPPVKRMRVEGESAYTCAKCSFVSEDIVKFREHIKGHNSNRSCQCPDCGLCFTIIPALKKHLFMVHKIRDADKHLKENGLNTEEEEFDSDSEELSPVIKKAKLMNGKDSDSEDEQGPTNPLECSVCHTEFESERKVRMHMRIHGMAFIKSARNPKRKRSLSSRNETSPTKSGAFEVETDTSVSRQAGKKSFEITTLREETMESNNTELDKSEECSVMKETREQEVDLRRVKQEVMD